MGTIAFALRTGDYLYYQELTDGGKCSFGGNKKDTFYIDGLEKKQIEMREHMGALSLKTKPPLNYNNAVCPTGEILSLDAQKTYRLMVAEQAGIRAGMGVVVCVTVLLLLTIVCSVFMKGDEA